MLPTYLLSGLFEMSMVMDPVLKSFTPGSCRNKSEWTSGDSLSLRTVCDLDDLVFDTPTTGL